MSLPCTLALADACAFAFAFEPPYPSAFAFAEAEAEAKPPLLFADADDEAEENPPPIPKGPIFTFPPNAWALLLAWTSLSPLGLKIPNGFHKLPTCPLTKSRNTPSNKILKKIL